MPKPAVCLPVNIALLCAALTIGADVALAQGSAGGSIGNDDKEISGSREVKHASPEQSHKSATHRTDEGHGRGNFDGRWSFATSGCPGAGTIGAMIHGGHFTTAISHGNVSPDGAFHATGAGGGVSFTAAGHMASSSGSGTFRRSDGCSGSWSASRL